MTYEDSEKSRKDYLASLAQKFDEGEAKGRAEEVLNTARNLLKEGVLICGMNHKRDLILHFFHEPNFFDFLYPVYPLQSS